MLLLWLFDPISMENRIWGDRNGTAWCDANSSRLCPVRCWKPVVSYHAQISGPVHGVTTHENSTTMSLYGYGLALYVVESSLGVPTGCAGKLRWQTAGMFGEAAMAEP
jgi:hypothetical protein